MSNHDIEITNNLRGRLRVEPIEEAGTATFLDMLSGSSSSLSSHDLGYILFEALDEETGTSGSRLNPDDLVFFGIDSTRLYTIAEVEHNRRWRLEFGEAETAIRKSTETPRTNITFKHPEGDEESSGRVILGAASLMLLGTAVSTALAPELKELSTAAWLAVSGTLALGGIVTGFLSLSRTIRDWGKRLRLTGRVKRFKK
jgi:hypothetical protein